MFSAPASQATVRLDMISYGNVISKHIPEILSEQKHQATCVPGTGQCASKDRASVSVDTITQPDFYIFPLSGALRKKTNKWTSKPGSHEKSDAYTHSQIV